MKKADQEIEKSSGIAAGKEKGRRPYKKPQLVVYGNVATLTAGVGGSNPDPGHTTPTKVGSG
jgi:hypothetical protein